MSHPQGTTEKPHYPLLERIQGPEELRALSEEQLPRLAEELRQYLIGTVSRTGGHLAAGLGVVELSIALHSVFDTPRDRLIWDVGHQAYPHKILTGRRERMPSLRQKGGLSGFLRRDESIYDAFGAGHSSTSISAALGMAAGLARQGQRRQVIAIIGDGALTAGMAFEALNHAGALDLDLLVILNDNDMSISPPVGALSNYLTRVLTGRFFNQVREGGKSVLSRLPGMREFMGRWEEHLKGMVTPGTLFEELGFNYYGPIDGHDLPTLISTLENLKALRGPRFLHLVTHKGKGFAPAEGDPCGYHGVSPFDPATGKMEKKPGGGPSYSRIFGDWLCDAAARDGRLVAITPAMCEGSGMERFRATYPERYYDVGIAEQHALTFAAGLACEGLKPVVAIYSTFLQRAYDQLIHDIALQNLDVTLAVDRAGLVGPDGATHAGSFDLTYARCIPNLVLMVPADEDECRRLLQTAYEYPGPALVRYPRGGGPSVPVDPGLSLLPLGQGELRRRGKRVALLAFGSMVMPATEVAETIDASLANMRFIKPLDTGLIAELAATHELLVTIEENSLLGGAGSAVNEWLHHQGLEVRVLNLGLPDRYLPQASREEQLAECGLDTPGILAAVRGTMASRRSPQVL